MRGEEDDPGRWREGDLGGREEGEEIKGTVSVTGGDQREARKARIKKKNVPRQNEQLGILSGGSQTPRKREAPRTQRG